MCAGGSQARTRHCNPPTHGGNEICPNEGNATETRSCDPCTQSPGLCRLSNCSYVLRMSSPHFLQQLNRQKANRPYNPRVVPKSLSLRYLQLSKDRIRMTFSPARHHSLPEWRQPWRGGHCFQTHLHTSHSGEDLVHIASPGIQLPQRRETAHDQP